MRIGMKKISLLTIICACAFLCACSNVKEKNKNEDSGELKEFYCNAKDITVNAQTENIMDFNISFFTKDKVKEVELLKVNGDEKQDIGFNVNCINAYEDIDIVLNHKYKGLYFYDCIVEMTWSEQPKDYKIENIELKINDEVRTIKFANPLSYKIAECKYSNGALTMYRWANAFGSRFLVNDEPVIYSFKAEENVTIGEVYTLDKDVKAKIENVMVNGKPVSFDDNIQLNKGDMVDLSVVYSSDVYSENSYVTTNFVIECEYNSIVDKLSGQICFNPVDSVNPENFSNLDKYIEYIIKNN